MHARRNPASSAESSPLYVAPSPFWSLYFACRSSSTPVTTPIPVTRALSCLIAESRSFSPPPSPAIAASATFRGFARCADARAASEMANTPSPPGVLFAVNVYRKRKRRRPSGRACCFVFGYRLGTGVPPWGPPHHPGPAVHSNGKTALHWAAWSGNRRIVRLLIAFKANVGAQDDDGCALRFGVAGLAAESPPTAVQVHAAALDRVHGLFRNDCRTAHARRRRGHPGLRQVTLHCAEQP